MTEPHSVNPQAEVGPHGGKESNLGPQPSAHEQAPQSISPPPGGRPPHGDPGVGPQPHGYANTSAGQNRPLPPPQQWQYVPPPPGHNLPPQVSPRNGQSKGIPVATGWIIIAIVTAFSLVVGVLAVGTSVVLWGDDDTGALQAGTAGQEDEGDGQPTNQESQDGTVTFGTGDITVDYYYDLACPACHKSFLELKPILQEGIDKNAFTLVMHPIDFVERGDHYGMDAASASLCAAETDQQAFFEFTAAAMVHIPPEEAGGMPTSQLSGLVDLDDDFAACVESGKYDEKIEASTDAVADNFAQLPTVEMDGYEQGPNDVVPKLEVLIASAD